VNGALVVDKPLGPTSHDVVARVRRAVGIDRIGHTGTLDPLATGVLVLLAGRATRLASLLSGADKEYVAQVRFGATTPSYDAEERLFQNQAGQPLVAAPPAPSPQIEASDVLRVLPEFLGTSWQVPPPFSAKKLAGVPAYKLARRRQPVEIKPAEVSVEQLQLVSCADGLAELRLVCSSGFYVRSLAHDLGQRLGCGAYLEGLRRTRAGDFSIAHAIPLEVIESEGTAGLERLIPMNRLLPGLPAVVLTDEGVRRASHGGTLGERDYVAPAEIVTDSGRVRLVDETGALVGIAEARDAGLLHPFIVLV
jgi:tRNA pseudouridine55 synthase